MPRKPKQSPAPEPTAQHDTPPAGPTLAYNLCRLGYCEQVVKLTEVAKIVTERTGRNMSRQRISSLLNAVRITDPTIEVIAKGLGVSPAELTKPRPK